MTTDTTGTAAAVRPLALVTGASNVITLKGKAQARMAEPRNDEAAR